MNILVVTPYTFYLDFTSSWVHHQAVEYAKQGHRVRVLVLTPIGKVNRLTEHRFDPPVRIIERDGVELCFLRQLSLSNFGKRYLNGPLANLAVCLHRHRVLGDFRPDVIHAHTIHFGGEIGAYIKKLCGAKLVITTHGGDTDEALDQYPARAKEICDGADALVAVSGSYRKKARRLGSTAPDFYIPNGFVAKNVTRQPRVPHRVTQIGTMIQRKHAEVTIQAVAALREKYPDITLTLAGYGPEQPRFEALCRELQMEDRVTFLGHLTNAEALAEMARAQVFSMPSVNEGFGIVYLEAMASGCVTIGTEGEGIDGIIVSGENGFLIPPLDAERLSEIMDRCFRDDALTRRVSDAARATANGLTWENNARQYLELFASLIKKTPS